MSPVNWNDAEARRMAQREARRELVRIGFAIEGQAKVNVTDNGQVDTGFLRSSLYTVGADTSTYGKADPSGRYQSSKSGLAAERELAPELTATEDEVLVAAGAAYAIYQEVENSFLYRALDQVRARRGQA